MGDGDEQTLYKRRHTWGKICFKRFYHMMFSGQDLSKSLQRKQGFENKIKGNPEIKPARKSVHGTNKYGK